MVENEYKRKLKRLEWLCAREEEINEKVYNNKEMTKLYDDEIKLLSDELHQYEEKKYPIPPPKPHELILYHLDRTGLKKLIMAGKMGISAGYFGKIISGNANLSIKMKDKIINFNYNSL